MRLLLAVFLPLPLLAQEPSPAPSAREWLTGNIDFGYRVASDVGGNFDSYRSVVNLGEGPKLFGLDLTMKDASRRLFDKVNIRANSWGGDPYNTAHMDAERAGVYNLSIDYRNIVYFDALPSFANPLLDQGILLNQRSFDMHRRLLDTQLELRPGARIIPYLAYTRDWGEGRGVTGFVAEGNDYPVANILRDTTGQYRGGVRFELNRFHLTVEQGGTTFKDDQRVFHSGINRGNRTTPVFGQTLFLSTLQQAYGVRGDSIYSKALLTANPAPWLDLYGQFLYSLPSRDVNYIQDDTGNFVSLNHFFSAQNVLVTSEAKQPHTSGSFGAELRPHRRLRITESLMTDRFHVSSAASLTESSILASQSSSSSIEPLVLNYNRQEANVLLDATSWLTLRGGHRYVWGDAQLRAPDLTQTGPRQQGELRMHVGLAGLTLRPSQRLNVHFDFEGASAGQTYFRTSLNDYQKGRLRARYRLFDSLTLAARFSVLNNQNPAPTIRYDFLSRENSISAFWTPDGGKWISLLGEYSRSTLRSDITFFAPQILQRERSFYREDAHAATGVLDLNLPAMPQGSAKISLGGSLFISSGSRPSRYYQPLGRLSIPLHRRVSWFAEWRWYGFAEPFYLFEGFRTHHFMTGLHLAL